MARGGPARRYACRVNDVRYVWGRWSPARLIVVSFASTIAVGTLLLRTPVASSGVALGWLEALFTATSATCVTGLIVVDTGRDLSMFGQVVVLALIQLGGLGIMSFSTLGLIAMGKRLRLHHRMVVASTLGTPGGLTIGSLLRHVIGISLAFELIGALLLAWRWPAETVGEALAAGLFHSISAFNNAGFSTRADSLIGFQGDGVVNSVVMVLIVCGGLGFPVLAEISAWARGSDKARSFTLHTKVALSVSAALIGGGALLIFLLEARGTLAHLALPQQLMASLFQAVTSRTAGFNTLPVGSLHAATLFVVLLLMFVGGSPGSTAGGVKTTSVGVLLAFVRARARGRESVDMFRRSVSPEDVRRAVAVVAAAVALLILAIFGLLVTEHVRGPAELAGSMADESALAHEVVFEAVSALGTVGLSTGLTRSLTSPGRLIIILLMFVGRIGPLTIAMALGKIHSPGTYRYPQGRVIPG